MKQLRGIKKLLISTFGVMFVLLASLIHSGVYQASNAHPMHGMQHASSGVNCATLCTATAPQKDEPDQDSEKKKDPDVPSRGVPAAAQMLTAMQAQHAAETQYASSLEPPPNPRPYILFTVFRV